MKQLVLCLILILCMGQAKAANWFEVTSDTNGSLYYVDVDSIYKTSKDLTAYWLKIVYKNVKNIPGETMTVRNKRVWYSKNLAAEDCARGEVYEPFQSSYYGLQDQILHSDSTYYPERLKPVPESVGETKHHFVCEYYNMKTKLTPEQFQRFNQILRETWNAK